MCSTILESSEDYDRAGSSSAPPAFNQSFSLGIDENLKEKRPASVATSYASGSIGGFVDSMSQKEQSILDRLFGRFIYSSNLAHSVVENEHAVNFLKKLRPSWIIPSRYKISNKMLDEEYMVIKEVAQKKIDESYSLSMYLFMILNN